MGSTQGPSPKGKGTQAMPVGARVAAAAGAGAKQGNGEDHTHRACRLSAQERRLLVAQIAYSCAAKRGFAPDEELRDCFDAEVEVKRLLRRP